MIAALLLCLAVGSAGCARVPWDHDHLDRMDRISVRAGEAQARNIRIQTVDPIPEEAPPLPPPHDGRRALAVMELYLGPGVGAAGPAVDDLPGAESGGGSEL